MTVRAWAGGCTYPCTMTDVASAVLQAVRYRFVHVGRRLHTAQRQVTMRGGMTYVQRGRCGRWSRQRRPRLPNSAWRGRGTETQTPEPSAARNTTYYSASHVHTQTHLTYHSTGRTQNVQTAVIDRTDYVRAQKYLGSPTTHDYCHMASFF